MKKLHDLHVSGALSQMEYERAKALLICAPVTPPAPLQAISQPYRSRGRKYDRARCVQVLRWLVIAEAVAVGIMIPVALFGAMVTENVSRQRGILTTEPTAAETATTFVGCAMLGVGFPILVVAWYGLYRLKPWSRWLYLGATGVSTVLSLVMSLVDFSFTWGFVSEMSSLMNMLAGGILAMSFASPAADAITGGENAEPEDPSL